jgi:DNA-directed RNA polymerase I, II, and III subunit RPABC2
MPSVNIHQKDLGEVDSDNELPTNSDDEEEEIEVNDDPQDNDPNEVEEEEEEENIDELESELDEMEGPVYNEEQRPFDFNNDDEDMPEYANDDDESDSDDEDEQYLQKFDKEMRQNIVEEYHPELVIHSNEDIQAYTKIVRNEQGVIVDPLHTTLPFVTKYERARILGERAKQINAGAKPLVKLDKDVIDGYLIASQEFQEKVIPFIIKRPLPNGGCEYWKFKDLELI